MKHLALLMMVLFASVANAQQWGEAMADASARLAQLKSANSALEQIKADFDMTKSVKMLAAEQHGKGRMAYSKAGESLTLDFDEPKGSGIAMKAGVFSVTTAGKTTSVNASKNPAAAQLLNMITACLTGNFDALGNHNEMRSFSTGDLFTIVIEPRNARVRKFMRQIVLRFSNADNSLRMMRLEEGSGDYSEYRYSNIEMK